MPSAITRRARHRRNRRDNAAANQPQPVTPILITDVDINAAQVVLTFDQPVALNGIPGITTNLSDGPANSAVKTSPNVVTLTFGATQIGAIKLNIPYRDPAIRNDSGGYVTISSFQFADA